MKSRTPKRQPGTPDFITLLAQCCQAVDASIPALRTLLLLSGLVAAGLRSGPIGDFLFLAGLMLQFSIWFENWWLRGAR